MKIKYQITLVFVVLLGLLVLINISYFWNILNPVFYRDIINKNASKYKIDPLLAAAIIQVESKYLPKAQSPVGAIGLMQIMPVTGSEIAAKLKINNFQPRDLYVPEINIEIGFYYLSELKKEFGDDLVAILASYNAGRTNVKAWKAGSAKLEISQIPFKETKKFTKSVLTTYRYLRAMQNIKQLLTFKI
jgi:soluble lytic murein transglycosylase